MPPNFTLLDLALPDIARLVTAMVQARDAVERQPGGIRKSRPAMNGGPTCLRTLALASAIGALTWPSSQRSIVSLKARDHPCGVQQVRVAGRVFARRPHRLAWCGLPDAPLTQPSRRTGLQQARLALGSLRGALRRADRNGLARRVVDGDVLAISIPRTEAARYARRTTTGV